MMEGSHTVRMNRPPELSEYSIKEDNSTSSSDNDYENQTADKPVSHGIHGFSNILGFSRSKSSSSMNEHRGWNIFRRERTPTPANKLALDDKEDRAYDPKEVSWWSKSIHRSRPNTEPTNNVNLFDEAISPEEKLLLSANDRLEAMLQDSFENVVDNSASPTKKDDPIETSDSDTTDMDSLREASRIIKSKVQTIDNDSPETPPNEPAMKVHFKPSNHEISIYDYVYESPNAKNSKNIDLMMVDTNSVTFGKFQRIASCLKTGCDPLRSDQSIVALCDYILTLSKECNAKLCTLESTKEQEDEDIKFKLAQTEDLKARLEDITNKYVKNTKEIDNVKAENNNLKLKLKEVIEFNNICKQFFVEYKGQIALLSEQINNEVTKNETLKEKQERISKNYESEKSRNMELSESLAVSQGVLQDMEKKYLENINKTTGPEIVQDLSCSHAENLDLKTKIEKITKGNSRLVKDCQRERKKVLDLRKQKGLTSKYVDGILAFQNYCIQFLTQYIMSFKSAIDLADLLHVEQQLFQVSSFNPLSYRNLEYHSERDLLAHLQSFESDSNELFQNLSNNILVQTFKKYTIEQNANKFLTSQLQVLRKESADKDRYIEAILQETNSLKLKLREK
ncbi:Spo21p [Kluyveromyces lactis]|uniref:KLLA0C03784p n=1 Tax=Kluyveromyces lactis (strain ATCC 8585 / CBS 2359 / DSM 70799 / NBRC 1267 / NRRL Y-1140 / WM37) TaxID=284590 RepID=Q6CUM4_KLULA|nr:uncharacterized protein KLLA0_C03784g [Kluyveromyces lactis]CAH01216.1 KLLA0C03784p [Kluyveromyces lactis]|eukprot:XP_452365.1 uncharacterized protein KLLA0_C03784g [Kluyveromyces lactis]